MNPICQSSGAPPARPRRVRLRKENSLLSSGPFIVKSLLKISSEQECRGIRALLLIFYYLLVCRVAPDSFKSLRDGICQSTSYEMPVSRMLNGVGGGETNHL